MVATLTLWALVVCHGPPSNRHQTCSREAVFGELSDCQFRLAHTHWFFGSMGIGDRGYFVTDAKCEAVEVQEVKP